MMQVIMDEYGYYMGGRNDNLKEALRAIDGVPNATYLVQDGRVFVFDKLVDLVITQQARHPDKPLSDWVVPLVAQAMVTAEEAVRLWGIVPEPYAVTQSPDGGWMILHRPFNARIPGNFTHKYDTEAVLAHLLVGKVQPGSGSFVYRGQPMTLCEPLDPALLPPMPVMAADLKPDDGYSYKALGQVDYEPGFPPISEALFNTVKTLEAIWGTRSANAARAVEERAGALWAQMPSLLQMVPLNDPGNTLTESGYENLAALRSFYPELSELSDGYLSNVHDRFMNRLFSNGVPIRDDDFLFYLLGNLADQQSDDDSAMKLGRLAGYALLRGDAPDQALAFARDAIQYDRAIASLAWRVASAMRFLVEEKQGLDLRGHAVTTMLDLFRHGRKFNVMPTTHTQQASDID